MMSEKNAQAMSRDTGGVPATIPGVLIVGPTPASDADPKGGADHWFFTMDVNYRRPGTSEVALSMVECHVRTTGDARAVHPWLEQVHLGQHLQVNGRLQEHEMKRVPFTGELLYRVEVTDAVVLPTRWIVGSDGSSTKSVLTRRRSANATTTRHAPNTRHT